VNAGADVNAPRRCPYTRVSDPIVQALSKWVFRPAQFNGQPVAVKVLLGTRAKWVSRPVQLSSGSVGNVVLRTRGIC